MKKRIGSIGAAIFLVLSLGVVAISPTLMAGSSTPPKEPPDIVGTITRIDNSSGYMRVLVEEDPLATAGSDKLWMTLDKSTQVFVADHSGTHNATAEVLKVGELVKAWSTGPIAESYPGQTGAKAIIVVS